MCTSQPIGYKLKKIEAYFVMKTVCALDGIPVCVCMYACEFKV